MKTKKKTKVIISAVVVLALICSVLAGLGLNAFARTSGTSGALTWTLDNGVFTVEGSGYGDNYSTSSRPAWYSERESINMVIVNSGVQALGDYWFDGCTQLTSVDLPGSLVKLGANCFSGCTALPNITMPDNCCEYYNNVFYGCTSLKWAVLGRDNTNNSHKIPNYTFYGCTNLENVMVGKDYTGLGTQVFRNCSKLTAIVWSGSTISTVPTLYFPSNAKFVGNDDVCNWCSSKSRGYININASCGSSLNYSYNPSARSLTLSGSGAMTSAPWNNWHYFIEDIELGSATSVCDDAFKNCEFLSGEVTVPATVTSIGANAFSGAGATQYAIEGQSVSVNSSAFSGNNLIFYGKRGSGVYDYVLSKRGDNNDINWKYYCLGSHVFGNNDKCAYCDKYNSSKVIEDCGEHNFVYQYRLGKKLYYKCSHCETADYAVNARELLLDFGCALTSDSTSYQQSNYDGRFDVYRDGYINGKDYKIIRDIKNGTPTDFDMTLTNENATAETKALYKYIVSTYGNNIISGQQESTWMGSVDYEMNYIYNNTGKYPAIRGLDFMNDDFSGCVQRAKAWKNRGGIVTICWHCGTSFNGSFNESQSEELTDAQWEAVLTEGTTENKKFIKAMDKAGNALLELQNEGVPVLWRPFHEFDGAWFWWGKGGSDRFIRLWKMMYNHFTYDLGLNNLIWVLGYCHNGTDYGTDLAEWYPGNRYCDIVGADTYEVAQNGAEARLYEPIYKIVGDAKPMAMHETGLIPTVGQYEDVPWCYFMTWHTTYITDENTTDHINDIYNSDYVITLDELPDVYH
ncbi:MAG: leucine-rich repeat protein [Eubacterium sp.]|nr:leucine-rich repeat protein [Eubacterium sp.]MBR0412244.1 leucine-rich repeat protein [Eubacterium sp.]